MKLALIAIIGITGAVLIGRPAMLSPFYEGPISLAQYGLVALWAGCLGMILIGSIGLVLVVGMEFIRNDIKKDNSRESKFGPNTQQFLESTSYWPKPIDLEEGKQYRYMDPDGVKQSIKDQISELWSITVCCLSMPLIAVIGISLSSRQTPLKPDEKVAFVVSSILLVGGALVPFILVPKKRLRFDYVNDVISLVYGELQVNRGDQILRYPREPKREMADTLPQKGTKKPFGRVERYGTAPNQYEMDRRYLIEVESSS